jgi:hypothetical protein
VQEEKKILGKSESRVNWSSRKFIEKSAIIKVPIVFLFNRKAASTVRGLVGLQQ